MKEKINFLIGLLLFFYTNLVLGVKFEVTDIEYERQQNSYESNFQFYDAFSAALESLLRDDSNDESLLALIRQKYTHKQEAINHLYNLLNQSSSVLRLITPSDEQPPYGEKISENWIFRLTIEGYDHTFWAIVDRFDAVPVYNYGFN